MSYKMPGVGDRVLYFANGGDMLCKERVLPAVVTMVEGSHINLSVFTNIAIVPVVLRETVVHREEVLNKKKKPYNGQPYWVWPEEDKK